ncbi:MAG: hypothetical protein EA352_09625, partial [Gemmatimonadales bacterium]
MSRLPSHGARLPLRHSLHTTSLPSPTVVPMLLALALLLAGPAGPALAQTPGGEPSDNEAEALAAGLLGFELLWDRVLPDLSTEERVEADGAFDAVSLLFFAGNTGAALTGLDNLARKLDPEADPTELRRAAFVRLQELNDLRQSAPTPRGNVPFLLSVPDGPPPSAGWPVVVALHGAGGDERMFFGAYGAGRLPELGREAGWIVVAPSTEAVARESGALAALLDHLAESHPLDRDRLVLVGHSMGAAAAWREARATPGTWAGVACLAGICAAPADGSPTPVAHLHVAAGTRDPLVPVQRVENAAEGAEAAGITVELHTLDYRGHTLWVGEHVPVLLEWARRIAPPVSGSAA